MSKKGRIIFGITVLLLIVATIVIVLTTTLRGGAKEIITTQFDAYVDNAQYVNKDGTLKEGATLPKGYKVETEGDLKDKVVDEDGNPIIVIWKLEFNSYERKGYTYNAETQKYTLNYFCHGPSQFGSDGDAYIKYLRELDVEGNWSNPNAGSWVSTAFSVLSIVIVCVVFFLIIRSSMGGGSKMMSFAKTKARVTTNIKVRFTDVA